MKTILLVGNPNVGKSVIFSRLTGIKVIASNYPGTTVGFTKGEMKLGDEKVLLIDVPGSYTLEPTCKAEEVACAMLKQGDLIINVVDATNLERHLYLTLQLLAQKKPMIVALNFWDETKHRGIKIDAQKLEEILQVPVVPTTAVSGEGLNTLLSRIKEARVPDKDPKASSELWQEVGAITAQVQTITHRHHTFWDRLNEATVHPIFGLFIGVGIMYLVFRLIRFISETLINFLLDPFFNHIYAPILLKLSSVLRPNSFFHNILIGQLFAGRIDFVQSMGVLTTGIYVEFGMVLPYLFSFYLLLSVLEDIGYLPRLAIQVDTLFHRIGLHGYSIIPMFLGMGCNVPGILATRILETRRERFIAATLISIGIPCAALQAMIIGLVGEKGGNYVAIVYLTLFLVWLCLGLILNLLVKGFSPDLVIEMPPYRLPRFNLLFKKLWIRIMGFLIEAAPIVLAGVFVVNLLYNFKIFDFVTELTAPVITKLFGLPKTAIVAILIGFLRKDVAVALLGPLNLSAKQLVVASTVLAIFFPCIATFTVLIKELGVKDTIKSTILMLATSLIVGSLLNLVL
uniref:Ferrous iron transporter B n=1 Tax=candidate division WOR-3 bacterium TaxID=2052148 RepID=A0A7C6AAH4_UNCW3